ncbi:MAG: GerMN domain-containing protein [Firmicutes bacterium]|nr:GerMN domain-containing protein [Bacillota bacterium]
MKKILAGAYLILILISFSGCANQSKTKIYYPDEKQEKLITRDINLDLKSDDKDEKILDELKKSKVIKSDTEIKNINLENESAQDENKILCIDFKNEFINLDEVGAESEDLILKSILKTFAEVYDVKKIRITINGENYESGHIEMEDGDYFDVE